MLRELAAVSNGKKARMVLAGVDLTDIGGAEPDHRSICLSKTVIGASVVGHAQSDSHSETQSEVRKRT